MPKKRQSNESRNYHLRELKARRFCEEIIPSDFRRLAEQHIVPRLKLTGYKIPQKEELAIQIAHNLILSGLGERVVSDSRRRKDTPKIRLDVWDAFIKTGFAIMSKGSEESGKVTRYQATWKLLELKELWKRNLLINTDLLRATETAEPDRLSLIYIHKGELNPGIGAPIELEDRKQLISLREIIMEKAQPGADGKADPQAVKNAFEYWGKIEDEIERINHNNLKFSWRATRIDPTGGIKHAFEPNPCVRQLYVGDVFRYGRLYYGRLYSWSQISGQNLSKEQRRNMLIDGEPTAELDFSCYQIRMLYHPRFDPQGDLYRPELIFPKLYGKKVTKDKERKAIARKFVKQATNICLNVGSKKTAKSAAGWLYNNSADRESLKHIIYKIEKITPSDVIERIEKAHPDIAHEFFKFIGAELTTYDGMIMRQILNELVVRENRPALGIHDSVVVRESDAEIAEEIMQDIYYRYFRKEPVISRVF